MATFADLDDFGYLPFVSDVAKILGVHLKTVPRYAREGDIPTHRLAYGCRYHVLEGQLVESMHASSQELPQHDRPVPTKIAVAR